ncbi:hypothetical protein ABZX82_02170 [Streptomyces griseoflavus]|uniref:hypothetical protein n=1 Tax=Streptomyces griseoflavus TaxID=35619 RepID=UPI00339EB20B
MASTRSTTSTSRKPRSASRAATRPARREEPEVEPEAADTEVSPAEAQEIEAEGYVTATLCGEEVQVLPPSMWRISWQNLLATGQLYAFAEKVLHPEDYDFFVEIDPTNAEFEAFVAEAGDRAGESMGKSRGRSRSGGGTRRR